MHTIFKDQNIRKLLWPSSGGAAPLCDPRSCCLQPVLFVSSAPCAGSAWLPFSVRRALTLCASLFEALSSNWEVCEVWVVS